MKTMKLLSIVLALLTLLSCFVACGGSDETEAPETPENKETVDTSDETEPEVKLDEFGREYVEDSIPLDLSFATESDNTVTFFTRDNGYYAYEMDIDETVNDTLSDSIFYRNTTVENRLGVSIEQICQIFEFGGTWNQTLRNAVLTKTGDYQASAIYASQGSHMAQEGVFFDVNKLEYIDMDKPWWNQESREELELFGTLYFLNGDIAVSQLMNAGMVAYNKVLLENYYPNLNVYELVDSHQWTIDKLYELSNSIHEDLNSSSATDDGDVVGLTHWPFSADNGMMDLWVAALGISITEKNGDGIPYLTMYSERSIRAYEKLQNLCINNPGCLGVGNLSTTVFANCMVLFNTNTLYGCEGFRDMKDAYGALPLPMLDEDQGYYATYSQNACSLVVVCSDCPESKQDMVGATLELMAAESYRRVTPQYMEVCLRSKYSESPDDARMYDLIVDGITIDFGFVYSTNSLNRVGALFRNLYADFAKIYESNKTLYETALENLIDKLDEISFMQ